MLRPTGAKGLGSQMAALGLILAVVVPSLAQTDDDVIARVNDRPISRKEMINILVEAHGVEVLQQLIILQLVKQETRSRNMRVTQADVDTEFNEALTRIAEDAGLSGEFATDHNKREALRQVLMERGVSMAEFRLGMERNAHLRKLVEKDLRITEETLREEFARTYGERVVVAHIQIDQRDARVLNGVMDMLNRGSDFAELARRFSRNPETATRGGEMEPFTFTDPDIPPALREAAFSLKEGGVSNPVLAGQFFHILKLLRRIPTSGMKFEDVRGEIEASVRKRAIPQAMSRLALELFQNADVAVFDRDLRARYLEFLEQGEQAPAP
jgi:foldase protein PrsA